MKAILTATLFLLCAGVLRAECTVTVSTVSVVLALSTQTATNFKITTVCTDTSERIISMEEYIRQLKESKQFNSDKVSAATARVLKFEEKIVEAEKIKQSVEAADLVEEKAVTPVSETTAETIPVIQP